MLFLQQKTILSMTESTKFQWQPCLSHMWTLAPMPPTSVLASAETCAFCYSTLTTAKWENCLATSTSLPNLKEVTLGQFHFASRYRAAFTTVFGTWKPFFVHQSVLSVKPLKPFNTQNWYSQFLPCRATSWASFTGTLARTMSTCPKVWKTMVITYALMFTNSQLT